MYGLPISKFLIVFLRLLCSGYNQLEKLCVFYNIAWQGIHFESYLTRYEFARWSPIIIYRKQSKNMLLFFEMKSSSELMSVQWYLFIVYLYSDGCV